MGLFGVCDVGGENHSKITAHMMSGEREFLIPVSAWFWREFPSSYHVDQRWRSMNLKSFMFIHGWFYGHSLIDESWQIHFIWEMVGLFAWPWQTNSKFLKFLFDNLWLGR